MSEHGNTKRVTGREMIEFCEAVEGGATLRDAARGIHRDPDTIRKARKLSLAFRQRLDRAMRDRTYAWGEDALAIADDDSDDLLVSGDRVVPNHVSVARASLRVKTRLGLMSKYNPEKFGDRVKHDGAVVAKLDLGSLLPEGAEPKALPGKSAGKSERVEHLGDGDGK